jgi:hypothetical protein
MIPCSNVEQHDALIRSVIDFRLTFDDDDDDDVLGNLM